MLRVQVHPSEDSASLRLGCPCVKHAIGKADCIQARGLRIGQFHHCCTDDALLVMQPLQAHVHWVREPRILPSPLPTSMRCVVNFLRRLAWLGATLKRCMNRSPTSSSSAAASPLRCGQSDSPWKFAAQVRGERIDRRPRSPEGAASGATAAPVPDPDPAPASTAAASPVCPLGSASPELLGRQGRSSQIQGSGAHALLQKKGGCHRCLK